MGPMNLKGKRLKISSNCSTQAIFLAFRSDTEMRRWLTCMVWMKWKAWVQRVPMFHKKVKCKDCCLPPHSATLESTDCTNQHHSTSNSDHAFLWSSSFVPKPSHAGCSFANISWAGERVKYCSRADKVFTEPNILRSTRKDSGGFLVHDTRGFCQRKINSKAKVKGKAAATIGQ